MIQCHFLSPGCNTEYQGKTLKVGLHTLHSDNKLPAQNGETTPEKSHTFLTPSLLSMMEKGGQKHGRGGHLQLREHVEALGKGPW